MKVGAILITPLRMRDDISDMISCDEQQAVSGPRIVYVAQESFKDVMFKVIVDNEVVVATLNFLEAFAVYLAVFYVFDMVYEKNIRSSLVFFQKMVVGLDDKSPVPKKVHSFATDVYTFSKTLKW